jgi:hypothetical protein
MPYVDRAVFGIDAASAGRSIAGTGAFVSRTPMDLDLFLNAIQVSDNHNREHGECGNGRSPAPYALRIKRHDEMEKRVIVRASLASR